MSSLRPLKPNGLLGTEFVDALLPGLANARLGTPSHERAELAHYSAFALVEDVHHDRAIEEQTDVVELPPPVGRESTCLAQ